MHTIKTVAQEWSTYAKVVMMISEGENSEIGMVTRKEIYIDRNGDNRSTETEENGLVRQNSKEIVYWEVEEAEPILQQQQISSWVQQNFIKLGKISWS